MFKKAMKLKIKAQYEELTSAAFVVKCLMIVHLFKYLCI